MSKISYQEYLALISNPDTTDEQIAAYSLIVKGEGGFDFQLQPDPGKVEISPADLEVESAMGMANGFVRWRRAIRFNRRIERGVDLPVLVAEGDSWFQFPILINEIVDQLENDYLVWCVSAAGDTAKNMVFGPESKGKTEYMRALLQQKERVKGFLFSAAGNDIIGENPETSIAALQEILKDFNGDADDVHGHIHWAELGARMAFLRDAYELVIGTVRSEPGFEALPIFIHGYDYAFPYPFPDVQSDPRDPRYAKKNEWLGEPLDNRGISDPGLRRALIRLLIDTLYDMLADVAGDSATTGVWLVDCRGVMPDVHDWNDEIHGTNDGFQKVAARFKDVLKKAGV